jgi:mono/diheme cytochrome c family protein
VKKSKFGIYLGVALAGVLLLAACAAPKTPAPAALPAQADVGQGEALYVQYCAACHGQNAEGTAVAIALPGHTEQQVVRQVRRPMGKMPAFAASQISDKDLELIARFITSLPAVEKHAEPLALEDAMVLHHWMTILALKAGGTKNALHHIDHILEMKLEHEHEEGMREARELLVAGKMHDAEHEFEEMLAGKADPGLAMPKLHLKLGLGDMAVKSFNDAKHHMEHYLAMATGTDKANAQEVLDFMANQDFHEAEEHMQEMIGMMPGK